MSTGHLLRLSSLKYCQGVIVFSCRGWEVGSTTPSVDIHSILNNNIVHCYILTFTHCSLLTNCLIFTMRRIVSMHQTVPPPFSCPGETELTCAPPGYGQDMSGVRKILQSLTEKHLLRTLRNMKKMKKNNKMNCYLAVISTCILQFCENSGKFLKALSHTWDRTGDSLNTIKLVVNKPTQIYIVL